MLADAAREVVGVGKSMVRFSRCLYEETGLKDKLICHFKLVQTWSGMASESCV